VLDYPFLLLNRQSIFFKTQLQVNFSKYNGFVDCAKQIAGKFGVRGVYQGLQATIIRDVPANAAYFGFYEYFRRALASPGQKLTELQAWKLLLAGGLAGMSFWITTYPLDVVKSSIQADSPLHSERKYHGYVDCASKIYAQQGIKGFFRGFTPCVARSFPANAVCFFAYEQIKKQMNRK